MIGRLFDAFVCSAWGPFGVGLGCGVVLGVLVISMLAVAKSGDVLHDVAMVQHLRDREGKAVRN